MASENRRTDSEFEAVNVCKDQVELIGAMNCRVSLNDKSFHSRCYVSRHDINLTGLDWIVPLKLMRFHNKTVQVVRNPTLLEESFGQCTKVRTSPKLKPGPETFQGRNVRFLPPLLEL